MIKSARFEQVGLGFGHKLLGEEASFHKEKTPGPNAYTTEVSAERPQSAKNKNSKISYNFL